MKSLRLILGDQLNINHSWFDESDKNVTYVMMEVKPETEYVLHHAQKVLAIFSAMRAFAETIAKRGHKVVYFEFDDPENQHSFNNNLKRLIEDDNYERFEYQEPDEYRLGKQLSDFCRELNIDTVMVSSEHFFTDRKDVETFFKGRKSWVMENFYRDMRKKHQILMDNGKPVGAAWNFDKSNRTKLPKNHQLSEPLTFGLPDKELPNKLKNWGIKTFGSAEPENFTWPVTREQSLQLLDYFVDYLLPDFGTYQDAMHTDHWNIYHSRLSFSMNTKMLNPKEVVKRVEEAYHASTQTDIAQAEGFIRQVLGWREFMRGIYWAHMPQYSEKNFFNHQRKLPDFYWSGETKMQCMKSAIGQSLDYAYAHHIQRLMITGNFALLNETHPDEVDRWYLGVYIDAFEWVEMPNTRGMSQFADGGIVATKPYVSSANYINKMSNYCKTCPYDHKRTTGENACPFNSLFWNFLDKNKEMLSKNRRMNFLVKNWEKRTAENRGEVLKQAAFYQKHTDKL